MYTHKIYMCIYIHAGAYIDNILLSMDIYAIYIFEEMCIQKNMIGFYCIFTKFAQKTQRPTILKNIKQ